jgi:hypothetical protein
LRWASVRERCPIGRGSHPGCSGRARSRSRDACRLCRSRRRRSCRPVGARPRTPRRSSRSRTESAPCRPCPLVGCGLAAVFPPLPPPHAVAVASMTITATEATMASRRREGPTATRLPAPWIETVSRGRHHWLGTYHSGCRPERQYVLCQQLHDARFDHASVGRIGDRLARLRRDEEGVGRRQDELSGGLLFAEKTCTITARYPSVRGVTPAKSTLPTPRRRVATP